MTAFLRFLIPFLCLGKVLMAQEQKAFEIFNMDDEVHPWTHLDFKNDPQDFQFAIVADRTGLHRKGVFANAVEKLNLLNPEFVMSVGDLIEGLTEDTATIYAEWHEFDSLVNRLEMPFFYLPGNHDVSNPVMEEIWERKFGRSYYHFLYKDALFIAMNSVDNGGTVSEEQFSYVQKALADHPDVRWTFLFLHHPMWDFASIDGNYVNPRITNYASLTGFARIEEVLKGRKYTVFAGHTHSYIHKVRQDNNYYVLATTGGGSPLQGPRFGQFDHITWVTLTNNGPDILNLRLEGMLDHDITDTTVIKNARAMVKASKFGHALYYENGEIDWTSPKPFTAQLLLRNEGDRALHFEGRFYHNHHLDPDQPQLKATLAPGTSQFFPIVINPSKVSFPSKVLFGEAPEPLQLDWTLYYDHEIWEPPFSLEGTYPLVFSSTEKPLSMTELPIFHDTHEIKMSSKLPNSKIYYTTDGSTPDVSAALYTAPFTISSSTTVKARIVNEAGQMGAVYEVKYEKISPRKAPKVKRNREVGLQYAYYEGDFKVLPDFSALTPIKSGVVKDFDIRQLRNREDHYAIQYQGYIDIPETGVYSFSLYSDDGSQLFIDDQLVVDNDGSHSALLRKGKIALEKGVFPFRLHYFEDFEGEILEVEAWHGMEGDKAFDFLKGASH